MDLLLLPTQSILYIYLIYQELRAWKVIINPLLRVLYHIITKLGKRAKAHKQQQHDKAPLW